MKFELNEYHFNVSDEDLIVDLQKVARELQKETLSRTEYDKKGKYLEATLRKRFGFNRPALCNSTGVQLETL